MTSRNDTQAVARVTTVVALDEATRAKALDAAHKLFGDDVMLEEAVDPSIVGGVILESGSQRYDASVRTQLAALRKSLTQAGGAL